MPQTAPNPESDAARACQVLVVEDDHDLRDALCSMLGESGYRARGAANGREALEYLRATAEHPPRVILLDLMMPVMSGSEFREEQLQDPRISSIPVVILSALVKADLFGASLGVARTLRKPVSLDDLVHVVAGFCD